MTLTIRGATGRGVAAGALGALLMTMADPAQAMPGTHGPSVSTWDTRASSVVLLARPGFLEGGHFFIGSYNANFTNTTGVLSSQFGMHYLNFRSGEGEPLAHGVSGTAVAVFSIPAMERYDNGIPKIAVGLFLGGAPSALIAGQRNYLSIPAVAGLALPMSPAKGLTIAPWFEFSPGINLDTQIHEISPQNLDISDFCQLDANGVPIPSTCDFSQGAVETIVSEGVDVEFSFKVSARAGLDLEIHLTDSFDFRLGGMYGTLGTAFQGTTVLWAGAGLVFRWDDIVPAVLPADRRLLKESCEDVERRFRTCPQAEKWTPPEGRPPMMQPTQPPQYRPAPEPGPGATPPAGPPAGPGPYGPPTAPPTAPPAPPPTAPPTSAPPPGPPSSSFPPAPPPGALPPAPAEPAPSPPPAQPGPPPPAQPPPPAPPPPSPYE